MNREDPDYDLVFEGFLQGNNHPDDIPHLIWLYKYFSGFEPFENAIEIWKTGEQKIDELKILGEEVQATVLGQNITEEQKTMFTGQIYRLDEELTVLERELSRQMTEASDQVTSTVYWSTLVIGLFLISKFQLPF